MRNKKFTLIELLIVIAIIGILATMLMAGASKAKESARQKRAFSDISSIELAVNQFKQDYRTYPDPSDNDTKILIYLMKDGTFSTPSPLSGDTRNYINVKKDRLKKPSDENPTASDTPSGEFKDPFYHATNNPKNYYYYTKGGSNNGASSVDIWSMGKGGGSGPGDGKGDDDINNWDKQ